MTARDATAALIACDSSHADALAGLHALAFARPWSAKDLGRLMQGPGAVVFAAQVAQDLLGFVLLRRLAGEAEIITLAVRPDARRHGVGQALVEAAVNAAEAAGAEVMWLEVAVDNDAAVSLYRSNGFETVGRRPRYYAQAQGEATDALVMRLVLNSAAA